jgi:phi13 family phage major tail protein
MAINTKKPMVKETVGALYYAFNTPDDSSNFTTTYEANVTKSNVVKNIGTTENSEVAVVRASGQDYTTVNQNESIEMAVEVVAFDPEDLAKMRGDVIGTAGLNRSGRTATRPFFAFGKVVKKLEGKFELAWYPKCQLVENTDDIATKEESFSEQNDTVTIKAYAYNDLGDKKTYVNNEMSKFPEGLTEELFFAKPILDDAGLAAAITPGT